MDCRRCRAVAQIETVRLGSEMKHEHERKVKLNLPERAFNCCFHMVRICELKKISIDLVRQHSSHDLTHST